jgi:hypothetical protein
VADCIVIRVHRERLSDGSEVSNVVLGNTVLHAVTGDGACDLADDLCRAIRLFAVDDVRVEHL